jgi:hypothetical protein
MKAGAKQFAVTIIDNSLYFRPAARTVQKAQTRRETGESFVIIHR